MLHINFQYIYYDTWQELLNAGENREIDIVFLAQKTEKRLKFYNFTDLVLTQHNKIIATSKHHSEIDIEDLYGKKVAVVKGSAITEYIKYNFPDIVLIESESEPESLQMLLNAKADYTIAEPVRVSYYIKKNNIDNLHIAGSFPYDYKLKIATRNDIPIINIILNKAIENISPAEKKALALKWGYEKELFFDKELLINILIVATVIIMFLIYLSILNRRLKKAKKLLREINATLEQKVKIEVEKNRAKELIMLNQSRFAQMGQVINMITHQWRQPLNTLSLINHTLFSKYKKNKITEDELKELKEKSNLQIQQMSKTIDDFKDFFKPRKEKSRFLLNDIISSLLNIVKPIFDKSHIEIVTIQTQDIYVEGYSNELAQAILNILYNAKDALIENEIKDKLLVIELKEKNNKAILSIKDNAGGIPEDIIQDIFNSYFSTKGENGTGIGLYMSKIIIEQHMHGKIIAINEDGGAVFQIELDKASKLTK